MTGKNTISRKEFIKKTLAGVVGFGLYSNSEEVKAETSLSGYRTLGKSGIKVIPVGFAVARTMEPSLVKMAIDRGMNFLDTGRTYHNGRNEEMLGKVVKNIRYKVVIESKISVPFSMRENLDNAENAKRIKEHMQKSLEDSLRALRTDYIDILLIHDVRDKDYVNREVVMEFLSDAKEKGHIRAHGFSVHTDQTEIIKSANKLKFYNVILVAYNHKGAYERSSETIKWNIDELDDELIAANKYGAGIVAMKTCLSGPCSPDGKSEASYKEAVKWVIQHEFIHTTATAMGNIKQIDENLKALE